MFFRTETRYVRREWGYTQLTYGASGASYSGEVAPNRSRLDEELGALARELSQEDWEIKSVMPITASPYFTEAFQNRVGLVTSEWAGGFAFAASIVVGIVVLCQRNISVSEEEWKSARQSKEAEREMARLRKAREAGAFLIKNVLAQTGIERVSAGLWGTRFKVFDTEYDTFEKADSAREAAAAQAAALYIEEGGVTVQARRALSEAKLNSAEDRARKVKAVILDLPIRPITNGASDDYEFAGYRFGRNQEAVDARQRMAEDYYGSIMKTDF